MFDNASLTAALLRDAIVERCREAGSVDLGDERVDLEGAAEVLARWDGAANLDSVGVVLWREVLCRFDDAAWKSAGALFAVDFDPDDPVATPHTLAAVPTDGHDPITAAVAMGRPSALERAGVAIDAPLGEVQWAMRGEHRDRGARRRRGRGACSTCSPPSAHSPPAPWNRPQEGNPLNPGTRAHRPRPTAATRSATAPAS